MAHNNEKTVIALKKAHTLLGNILKMIDNNQYCIDVIQQNLAIIGLIKSANLQLLEGHINCCVKDAIKEKNDEKLSEMMKELLRIMQIAQNK